MTEDDVRSIINGELRKLPQDQSDRDNSPVPLILVSLSVMFLVFVFWGDPDIWDLLHTKIVMDLT